MPLQQDRAAVFWWSLEAFVNVFHEQVHAIFVQGLHSFLYVTALKRREHLQDQPLGSILERLQFLT